MFTIEPYESAMAITMNPNELSLKFYSNHSYLYPTAVSSCFVKDCFNDPTDPTFPLQTSVTLTPTTISAPINILIIHLNT